MLTITAQHASMSAIADHRELIYSQLGELELRIADTMRLLVCLAQ
ncbi:hypothetical protein GJA_5017 [Janthinobacterium agaricidamnosum NBRC 102515 = DSM 9628]|uniref:Uncharacterized protein n=1 Tax=Janthinobacterium agaricidamnosum NBRC 102515 = DSM 9628 TaxID=1349767 RepID=W0VCI3_9BURK|nr:hypothetical protein GJA_5017 [Janthinobacterium agaricidamnosum NBRC 102515 = DSM 9628]